MQTDFVLPCTARAHSRHMQRPRLLSRHVNVVLCLQYRSHTNTQSASLLPFNTRITTIVVRDLPIRRRLSS